MSKISKIIKRVGLNLKKKKFKFKFYRVVVFHGSSNKNQNPHGAKLCLINTLIYD